MQLLYWYCLCLKALVQLQQWLVSYSSESNTKPWHVLDTFLSVALRLHMEICFHKESGPFLPAPNTRSHSPKSRFLGHCCIAVTAGLCSIVTLLKTPNSFYLLFAKGNCGLLTLKRAPRSIHGFWAVLRIQAHAQTRRKASGEHFLKKLFSAMQGDLGWQTPSTAAKQGTETPC